MSSSGYKKWTLLIILLVVSGIIAFSLITTDPDRRARQAQSTSKAPNAAAGPLVDSGNVPSQLQLDTLPDDPAYLANLGDTYFESQNFEQAIEIYKKVIELNPNDVDTVNDLGLAYFYTNRREEAVRTLKKGTEVNPSFQRIWLSLGYVLMSSGQAEEAKMALKKSERIDPDSEVGREAARMIRLLDNPR